PKFRASRPKSYAVLASPDGKILHVAGMISSGITMAIKDAIKKYPSANTVVLSSTGGLLVEGLAIANVIRKHGLNTHAEVICASACTFAYLAGRERSIAPSGAIGFHQSSKPLLQFFLPDSAQGNVVGNDVMRSAYVRAGLENTVIDAALKIPPHDMWFPEATELLDKRVATRLSLAGEFQVPGNAWTSASGIETELVRDPVLRAARSAKPRQYRFALSDAWINSAVGNGKSDASGDARATLVRQLLGNADQFDDELLGQFVALEHEIWGSKDSALNSKCDGVFGAGFPVSRTSDPDQLTRQNAVLLKMIQEPVERRYPSSDQFNTAEAKIVEFWGRMISEAPFNGNDVGRSFCKEPGNYYDVLITLPVVERIDIFRSLAVTSLRQSGMPQFPMPQFSTP
ncbi:MAG: hypothetical protein WBO17_07020, partial [Sphingorhabdus sp.]